MNPRSTFRLGILVGSTAFGALFSLFDDYLGKDGYIRYVQNHWTSGKISVPLAIVSLLFVICAMIYVVARTHPRLPSGVSIVNQVRRNAEAPPAAPQTWGYVVKGEKKDKLVLLSFGNGESKLHFEMAPPTARRVAQTIIEEADYAEKPGPDEPKRKTAWAKLDSVDLDDGKKSLTRPKAPDWPTKS